MKLMNELRTKRFDLAIAASVRENILRDAEKFLAIDDSGVKENPKFKRKIMRMVEYGRATTKSLPSWKIILVAALLTIVLVFTACMCIPTVREALWSVVLEWHEEYIKVEFKPNESTTTTLPTGTTKVPPKSIEIKAKLTCLPEGYTVANEIAMSTFYMINYKNLDSGEQIRFVQMTIDSDRNGSFMVDSDNAVTKAVYVNGFEGVLFEYADTPGIYALTWQDISYKYLLYGNFESTDEILKIAQGVKVDDEVNKSPPKTIEQKAVATYLPEGYSSLLTIDDSIMVSFDYYDAEGNIKFVLMQTIIDENGDLTVDKSEEDTLERIKVNDFKGILISYADKKNGYQIVWRDESYTYWIYGEFESVDELLKIAEGIKTE